MTEILDPAAEGFYTGWTLGAGPDKVAAVLRPDDEDTSYIETPGPDTKQSFQLTPSSIPPGSTINSVQVTHRAKRITGGCNDYNFLRLGGTNSEGPAHALTSSYVNYSDIIPRPGGGAWSTADLATLEVGIRGYNPQTRRATTLYITVDYTPPAAAAGNMFLVF